MLKFLYFLTRQNVCVADCAIRFQGTLPSFDAAMDWWLARRAQDPVVLGSVPGKVISRDFGHGASGSVFQALDAPVDPIFRYFQAVRATRHSDTLREVRYATYATSQHITPVALCGRDAFITPLRDGSQWSATRGT